MPWIPDWRKKKHEDREWNDWKERHINWETQAAKWGWTVDSVEAWVRKGDVHSPIPNGPPWSSYHPDRLGVEVFDFKESGEGADGMEFGTGLLYVIAGASVDGGDQLTLKDANDNKIWGLPVTWIRGSLSDSIVNSLLKEAWFLDAKELLEFCSKANVPLKELYVDDLQNFKQTVSVAARTLLRSCGMKPIPESIEFIYDKVIIGLAEASSTVQVDCDFEDNQTPVVSYSMHGNIPNLRTW